MQGEEEDQKAPQEAQKKEIESDRVTRLSTRRKEKLGEGASKTPPQELPPEQPTDITKQTRGKESPPQQGTSPPPQNKLNREGKREHKVRKQTRWALKKRQQNKTQVTRSRTWRKR